MRNQLSSKTLILCVFWLTLIQPILAEQKVTVTVGKKEGADLSPSFLGLSYESSLLLPMQGHYYFDPLDSALVRTFKTLGIKSLRVGANAVDDPHFAVPNEKDIDTLFAFARAAGVRVIYSFRLKNGDPAVSARLGGYIESHYADLLDSFSIGNEPEYYFKHFDDYLRVWKPHYNAILQAVPNARMEGPSSSAPSLISGLAQVLFSDGHLTMITGHQYFLGGGRESEKDPSAARGRSLSNDVDRKYEKYYNGNVKKLATKSIPFRFDEINSCYNGGAKGSSDTYASTLWALDCTHWWAAHHIVGLNYHTGDSVGRDGKFGPPNYAAFVHQPDGPGFVIRPQAYGLLAFTAGAQGNLVGNTIDDPSAFNFTAYAYGTTQGDYTFTLINKSFGGKGDTASVTLQIPTTAKGGRPIKGRWQRMDLRQVNDDVAAEAGITLGGSAIDATGRWSGKWETVNTANAATLNVQVASASAAILQFVPLKTP